MFKKDCTKQLLEDEKIEEIYKDIKYKDSDKIEKIKFTSKKCIDDNEKIIRFNILNNNKDILNDGEVKRIFYKNKNFRGKDGSGRVAFHDVFFLKEDYKSKYNLARKIHEKEIDVRWSNCLG